MQTRKCKFANSKNVVFPEKYFTQNTVKTTFSPKTEHKSDDFMEEGKTTIGKFEHHVIPRIVSFMPKLHGVQNKYDWLYKGQMA